MNEEEKQAIKILKSFEPIDLFEGAIYFQALEKLTNLIEKLQKEIKELKQDRNNNYQMIALAQNVKNQQYYIKKEIEHYKEYIEKLQNDNKYYKGIINKLYGEMR